MRLHTLFISALLILAATFYGCKQAAPQLTEKDFTDNITALSANDMEGREVGTKGAQKASDYIASVMAQYGLEPYGEEHSFFQNFDLTRCEVEKLELSLVSSGRPTPLTKGVDFETERICKTIDTEAPLVFVNYGVNAKQNGYNDYANVDVKGKVVVVMNGFPGHSDTTSAGWKAFANVDKRENTSIKIKRKMAWEQGATAIIVVSTDNKAVTYDTTSVYPRYEDAEYLLNSELTNPPIPCFKLSADASKRLLANTGIVITDAEAQLAQQPTPASKELKNLSVKLAISIKPEVVKARNVLGILRGKDTSKCIVVAAHYDHLGIRGKHIYNGADDNASGVAGMLAMAKYWKAKTELPPCNIVFASWTAEEKGMIGSRYFVQQLSNPKSILLSTNFDMISRSEPEDTACRIVTVGRLKGRDDIKEIAIASNAKLANPLTLDLWETAGAGGSDYISFAEVQIPTLSFFSGMHADYHSPADLVAKVEWAKMIDIVNLTNNCLENFMETLKKK